MMSANQKTHIILGILTLLAVTIPLAATTFAEEQELVQAKDAFNEMWQSATDAFRRRSQLEQNLATFDSKVEEARQNLEKASKERASVQQKIVEQRKLVDAIKLQLESVVDARGFYESMISTQQETLVAFVRFVASKDIVATDSGPVFGGTVLRGVFHSSLGESIEDQLARLAILKAREEFIGKAGTLITEAGKTEERLRSVASDLGRELSDLQKQDLSLKAAAEESRAFIDTSWREKKLNENELRAVVAEYSEANARLAELQTNLQEISVKLRTQKVDALTVELTALEKEQSSLETEVQTLERRDVAMHLLETSAMDAEDAMKAKKNSDPKNYKKIELRELQIKNAEETLATETGGTALYNETLEEIGYLKSILVLLKQGYPDDAVVAYLSAKRAAANAGPEREALRASLETVRGKLEDVASSVGKKLAEIEEAKRESAIDGVSLFAWPVIGPITAGYHDADYVKVFGIPHQAIDIATPQSSIVRSIADGIVFATRDGGATGYSYILIGHKDGYASLYGHVSAFLVKKGDLVNVGDAIALSGGLPGTHGAGHMTTGAHVHLEVTKDGEHIDPRLILPAR